MAKPIPLTRQDLAKFLPDQRSIRAFEQLFDVVPADILEVTLSAGIADAKATNAIAVAEGLKKLAELAALAPLPEKHNSVNTDYLEFNRFANHALDKTQVGWGEENGTVEIGMGYDSVIQRVGLESYYRIKASGPISKGDLVMFTGAVGASGVVTGARSTGIVDGQYIMGVATMDMATNEFGYVTHFGVVRGFRTNGASVGETWNDGDILWYNPSYPGGLTKFQPASPTPEIIACVVITASSGNNGSVLVRPTFMPRLDQLTGVNITSPVSGEVLKYDGTSWTDSTLALDDLSDVVISSPTLDQILKYNGTSWVNSASTSVNPNAVCKAWAAVNMSTGLIDSYNVASGVFNSGDFYLYWDVDMSDTSYAIVTGHQQNSGTTIQFGVLTGSIAVGSARFLAYSGGSSTNLSRCYVAVFDT